MYSEKSLADSPKKVSYSSSIAITVPTSVKFYYITQYIL